MTEPTPERELLNSHLLADAVADSALWAQIEVLDETLSTNADLAAAARDGAPAGSIITTEFQAQGRGRLDRTFTMPPRSGIAVSTLIRPVDVPFASWSWLPLITGLAVHDVAAEAGVTAGVKWPNDVLVDGRKISGILLESLGTDDGPAAVIGAGINVTLTADERPAEHATSLLLEGANQLDRTELLIIYLRRLEHYLQQWVGDVEEQQQLREHFVARCITVGQDVKVLRPDGKLTVGLAETIDDHGRLVVAGEPLSAGDVTHVRPQSGSAAWQDL